MSNPSLQVKLDAIFDAKNVATQSSATTATG